MPTTHVEPGSGPLLQDIANTLWKARKVVVITGAGISTNSGIPDFRSENGLYSLIQAQFEAAQQSAGSNSDADVSDASIEQRPAKRQRRSYDDSERSSQNHDIPFPGLRDAAMKMGEAKTDQRGQGEVRPCVSGPNGALPSPSSESRAAHDALQPARGMAMMEERLPPSVIGSSLPGSSRCLPSPEVDRRNNDTDHSNPEPAGVDSTAPFPSSPPALTLGTPQPRSRVHLLDSLPGSSSPLSSPPPITFDPYEESTDTSSSRDTESSRSQSEEPSSVSTPLLSSQTSFVSSSRPTLPIMKGRDLFDAQIWSCPVKTSVFYTFVSTLREKVRSAEPTASHRFVSVLRDSRKLVRCYTQNIDQLEERVGLSTSLSLGVGSRYRFSLRAGRNSGGTKGAKSVEGASDSSQGASQQDAQRDGTQQMQDESVIYRTAADANKLPPLRPSQTSSDPASASDEPPSSNPSAAPAPPAPNRGVECVFLHGSLAELRCFVCARTASWDEDTRLADTLAGRQPTCPHCAGATAAREERGKRALGVGKLRPDIVLYGEEHPQAHLISPLIQHDLSLGPDMLLILGTSMRVHGLKVLVKEFAKAVHDRGGKVVFVNFTKPPESVWADVIDYWVQWDCDAWVSDLQQRKPALWLPPGSMVPEEEKPKMSRLSRRQSGAEAGKRKEGVEKASKKVKEGDKLPKTEDSGLSVQDQQGEEQEGLQLQKMPSSPPLPTPPKSGTRKAVKISKEPKLNPDAKRPVSTRDHKLNGAYLVWKIMQDLRRITGASPAQSAASPPEPTPARPKAKKPRKSAPAALGLQGQPAAAVEHGTPMRQMPQVLPTSSPLLHTWTPRANERPVLDSDSSISAAVKTRKRKQTVAWRMIGGVETRISLHDGGEPETPLPHTTAVLRPSSVPKSRRLPPPTPTTPQEPPPYSPFVGIPQPQFTVPNRTSQPQATAPSPAPAVDHAISTGFSETDRLIARAHEETRLSRPTTPSQLRLPPLNILPEAIPDYQPHQLYHHHHLNPDNTQQVQQQQQHQQKLAPLEPKVVSPGPRKGISSNVGSPVALRTGPSFSDGGHNPFFFADPGVGWFGYPAVRPPRAPKDEDHPQHPHNHHRQLQHHMHLQQAREREREEQEQLSGVTTDAGAVAGARAGMQDAALEQQQQQQQLPWYGLGLKREQQEEQHQPQQAGHGLAMGREQQQQQQQQQLLPSQVLMLEREEEAFPFGGQGLGLGLRFGVEDQRHQQGKSEAWGTEMMGLGLEDQQGIGGVESGLWCPDEQLRKEQEAALMLSSMRGSVGDFC